MSGWGAAVTGDPRATHAPEVLAALQQACGAVRAASDPALLELARLRLADLLGATDEAGARPWGEPAPEAVAELGSWPTAPAFDDRTRAALALTEQFAVDVTGVAPGPLAPAAAALEGGVLAFAQGLYLLDVGLRAEVALGGLFDVPVPSTGWAWADDGGAGQSGGAPADPMAAIDALLRATARLDALDPVLRELVRLRGARHHQCRRCQSVRNVAALAAGAGDELLDAADPAAVADLPPATRAALRLTDAVLVGRPSLPDELVAEVRAALSPAEAVELVCYLVRNAANKLSVAFAADAAVVEGGVEYQLIDADGETVTVDGPPAR